MSTLFLLPPTAPDAPWPWLQVEAGGALLAQGQAALDALPAATERVLLWPAERLSWLRCATPPGPARRWRQALPGLLEERLLDEAEGLHFLLPAQGAVDNALWVGVTPRAPLAQVLGALDAAGVELDAAVPELQPGASAQAHVIERDGVLQLLWADAEGAALLPLAGDFLRQRLLAREGVQWSAEPAAQQAAQAWLGQPLAVRTRAQALMAARAAGFELRQGELTPRLRGLARLRQLARTLRQPEWRWLRRGLIGLLAVNLVGLNALAWQQRQQEKGREAALQALVQQAFPQLPAADPARLPGELARLRQQAGQPGVADFEVLLGAAARHWPPGAPPPQAIAFTPGRLSLVAPGWAEPQVQALGQALRAEGWQLTQDGERLHLSPQEAP